MAAIKIQVVGGETHLEGMNGFNKQYNSEPYLTNSKLAVYQKHLPLPKAVQFQWPLSQTFYLDLIHLIGVLCQN